MKYSILSVLLCSLFCLTAGAITIPREHIFIFERNTNTNYVCYDINLQNGKLNQKEPLKAYWVLGGETRIEDLTFLDRKMAFGVKVLEADEAEATICMAVYNKVKIRVCKHKGKWVGIAKMNGREIVLQKMFAQMKQPMNVKCEYVDVYGTDLKTGKRCKERIIA